MVFWRPTHGNLSFYQGGWVHPIGIGPCDHRKFSSLKVALLNTERASLASSLKQEAVQDGKQDTGHVIKGDLLVLWSWLCLCQVVILSKSLYFASASSDVKRGIFACLCEVCWDLWGENHYLRPGVNSCLLKNSVVEELGSWEWLLQSHLSILKEHMASNTQDFFLITSVLMTFYYVHTGLLTYMNHIPCDIGCPWCISSEAHKRALICLTIKYFHKKCNWGAEQCIKYYHNMPFLSFYVLLPLLTLLLFELLWHLCWNIWAPGKLLCGCVCVGKNAILKCRILYKG